MEPESHPSYNFAQIVLFLVVYVVQLNAPLSLPLSFGGPFPVSRTSLLEVDAEELTCLRWWSWGMVITSAAIDAMIQVYLPAQIRALYSGNIRTDPGRHSEHSGQIRLYSRYSGLGILSKGHEYARICQGSPECLLECIRMKVDYLPPECGPNKIRRGHIREHSGGIRLVLNGLNVSTRFPG